MPADWLFYVSGHGFGHATRSRALIAAMRDLEPGCAVHARSAVPASLFRTGAVETPWSYAELDAGLEQRGGLDLDLPATLAAHERFVASWDEALAREVAWLRELRPRLVVADVPPLAFAACHAAGVPAVAVANFGWDWILEEYVADDARWGPIVERYREAYARAGQLFRLPFCGDFPAFERVTDVPLLVNRSRRTRADCREALGVGAAEARRLVLVSFGGFGGGPVRPDAREDLSSYLFAGVGDAPPGFPGDWLRLPDASAGPHEDWIRAADAVIGKLGYGTVAEVIAHRTRFLYLDRQGFREAVLMEQALRRHACARAMSRSEFERGRWRDPLDALFAQPEPGADAWIPTDGAEVIGEALLAY